MPLNSNITKILPNTIIGPLLIFKSNQFIFSGWLISFALLTQFILILRKGIHKIKGLKKKNRTITINNINNQQEQNSPTQNYQFNNISYNPEVTTAKGVMIMAVVVVICIWPVFYVFFFNNSPMSTWWSEFDYYIIADFSLPFCLSFIYPAILYSQNSRLRNYVKESIFHRFWNKSAFYKYIHKCFSISWQTCLYFCV